MAEQKTIWLGASDREYEYLIYPIGTPFNDSPANYIFAKQTSGGSWTPIYIGQTNNLSDCLADHEKMPCVKRHGVTHIHAHTGSLEAMIRKEEESALVAKWDPPCNKESETAGDLTEVDSRPSAGPVRT